MATRLIIDGNSVYEIDEICEKGGQSPDRKIKPEQIPDKTLTEERLKGGRKRGG